MKKIEEKIVWHVPEYGFKKKSVNFFWAFGLIIIISIVASLYFKNYLFAILILISSILLLFYANKKPQIIKYEINDKGIKVGEIFYPYRNLKGFSFDRDNKDDHRLLILTERSLFPIMSLPLHGVPEENLEMIISEFLLEKKIRESTIQKIIEVIDSRF